MANSFNSCLKLKFQCPGILSLLSENTWTRYFPLAMWPLMLFYSSPTRSMLQVSAPGIIWFCEDTEHLENILCSINVHEVDMCEQFPKQSLFLLRISFHYINMSNNNTTVQGCNSRYLADFLRTHFTVVGACGICHQT
jgi:hypothetical protein